MKSFLLPVLLLLVLFFAGQIAAETAEIAQSPENENLEFSQAEQEFIDLLDEYEEKQNAYWKNRRVGATKNEDGHLVMAASDLVEPSVEYIPRLQAFEEAHRGEEIGLAALSKIYFEAIRQIYHEAVLCSYHQSPADLARKKCLAQIGEYAKWYGVAGFLASASYDDFDSTFIEAAEAIIESPEASPIVRDYVRYSLAKWWIRTQRLRVDLTERKQALLEGAASILPEGAEINRVNKFLNLLPEPEIFGGKIVESVKVLDALAADEDSPRLLKRVAADSKYRIIRYVADPAKRTVSEIATDYLFKYRHLQKEMPAPALEIELIDGRQWKMADQVGKVVIVQFSFTGCGPCAQMYPDLKELAEKYPEELAVLTIMRDETAEDIHAGIESGKLTWKIAWDGDPGEMTNKWSVNSFPTTYVVNQKGKIAATNTRGMSMKSLIARLIEEGS